MKTITKIHSMLLLSMLAIIFVCCNNGDSTHESNESRVDNLTNALTEYSLEGTQSYWTNLDPNGDSEPILVNSDKELSRYIVGTDYPPIDFSKKTLLLVCGGATNGIRKIDAELVYNGDDEYLLNILVKLNMTDVALPWIFAATIPALTEQEQVRLNKIQYEKP